jgi:GTPase SAR1 family protein
MDTNQPNIWDVETRSGLSLLPSRGELHTGEGYKDATFEQPMLRPSYEPQSADNNQNASKLATGTATAPPAPTKLSHQGADQRHKRTSLTPFKWFSSGLVQNADKRATEPVIQSPRDLPAPETSYPPAADKVLLLGISEFGKSTIFNALKLFFRDFTEKERSIYTRIIVSSILESTKVVIAAMESRNRALDDAENMAHKQTVLTQLAHPEPSLAKTRAAVRALWADKSFLATYRDTRYYQNSDNILYYVRNIERLTDNMYRPTDRDIPSSRMKSTGITKSIFFGECAPIEVHDLGGCRLERKQWAHMSKNVSTIIFTVDTTSYHRVLIEDETTNRMQEQLMLFEGIGNSYWFPSTRIILVMTKIDQLGSTLQRYPLQQFFPTIPVPPFATPLELEDFYLEALEYQFRSLIKDAGRRGRLHIVRANATNDNTYIVVTDILLAMKGNSNSSLEIYD